ncbi:MAG TPA: N-acetylmuramoyl-L-alanine amidase [Anaerolineae bacterium]|nr:N-acetylmuramoyl-L-alanine amidase [Anaerolineae bacterium]
MDRRLFIKLLSHSAFVSYGLLTCPVLGWPESAFDLALEGQDLIQKKDFPKAIKALQEALRIDPKSDWAFGLLGRAHLGLDQKAEAVAAFRQAVRLNPFDTYSRMMIEITTQKPIPRSAKKKKPLTPLEKEAMREEEEMLKKLHAEKGLGYKVKRVVIDAGHGGFDPGAVGQNGLKEKEVTLDLALKLHERLAREGKIKSFLTRTGDYYIPLSARTVTANQFQADLFISIHINANKNREPNGSETYFCSEKASSTEAAGVAALENSVLKYDEPYKKKQGYIDIEEILFKFEQNLNWSESGEFAKAFQARFKKRLPLKSRGVHSADFYVLRRAKMPAILLETGFISNPDDEAMLTQPAFREKIVDAVARGLE